MTSPSPGSRRAFLQWTAASGVLALQSGAAAQSPPPGATFLRGIIPIAWTPCTPDDKLDLDALAAQAAFCNRGGVAGLAWPQNASGWQSLSEEERFEGAEALLSVKGRLKRVIGVQTRDFDSASAIRYARHAATHGADAIISLPPAGADDEAVVAYFRAIAAATDLPLMIQSVGDFSVARVARLAHEIPSLRAVKDEAGNPLERFAQLRAAVGNDLAIFSGGGGRTLLQEMHLGFQGCCPYVGLADLYQTTFDLWQAGRQKEAFDLFGKTSAFNSIPFANEYVLVARNVFPEGVRYRQNTPVTSTTARPDAAQKAFIREALHAFLGPDLKV